MGGSSSICDGGGRLEVGGSLDRGGCSRCDGSGRLKGGGSLDGGGSSRLGSGCVDGCDRSNSSKDTNPGPLLAWSTLEISSADSCRSSLDDINRVGDGGMDGYGSSLFDCGTDDGCSINTGSIRLNRGPTEDVAMILSRHSRQPMDTLHSSGSIKEAL